MISCLPQIHTTAAVRAWGVWRHAHPHWVAKVVVPACVRAGALALPLALPGAAILPPVPHGGVAFGGPALYGPAYEIGAGFVPGVYGMPLQDLGIALPAAVPAGISSAEVGNARSTAFGESPILTPMTYDEVPERGVPVDEPSTGMVMVAALFFAIRHRVCK